MADVIGFDIGGANTKATFIETADFSMKKSASAIEYFPIWRKGKEELPELLRELSRRIASPTRLDGVGVTMTAELSDVYWTKSEGVNHILDCVVEGFTDIPIFVLDVSASLRPVEEARKEPLMVAAANWAATGWMVSQAIRNCIIVDIGSTTTSIIPVFDGKILASGKTDVDKLLNGELVYTGSLRTNVATIVNSIPVRNGMARVSSELFAQSGDVHLLLGHITPEEYAVDTADGRGKTITEAMARLARVICADIEMLSKEEITDIARYIHKKQVEQIASGLEQVRSRAKRYFREEPSIVVTGLGRKFLAKKAARRIGFQKIIDLANLFGTDAALLSPSAGVALMVASRLEGGIVRWTQL